MIKKLKLMCILAHPDDESLGLGGALVKYAAEDIETYLITATRGQAGWPGPQNEYPGPDQLGKIREAELHAAAQLLQLQEVIVLDYLDGQLAQADHDEAIAQIVTHIRRIQPDVVVTFDPFGVYGHPDHIAISQMTTAAVIAAADHTYTDERTQSAHQVQKLYYRTTTQDEFAAYEAALGNLAIDVNGQTRHTKGWEPWAVTTHIATEAHWPRVWQAISCHKSQIKGYLPLQQLSPEQHAALWGEEYYYRVFSLVNGYHQQPETDLFAGLRTKTNRKTA